MAEQLGVFVYGTLRPGGWNHDQWLAPLLAGPCRPARLPGMALHHYAGLPAIVPAPSVVVGEVADLRSGGYDDALTILDFLEDTSTDHYRRVVATAELADGGTEPVWVWVAGARLATELGPASVVASGDWLAVPGAMR